MGGVLNLHDKVAWVPARWVYNTALEGLAEDLRPQDPELAELLLSRTSDRGFEYLDLSKETPSRIGLLREAAIHLLQRTVREGSTNWHDSEFYPGYLARLVDLVDLLSSDPRVAASPTPRDERTPPGGFEPALAETITWCAPRVDFGRPRDCLRSPELRPRCHAHSNPDTKMRWTCKAGCRVPHQGRTIEVEVRRRLALLEEGGVVDPSVLQRTPGRLLCWTYDRTLCDGATPVESNGFFEDWDLPPWDLWVTEFRVPELWGKDDGGSPEHNRVLVSWIPPEFVETVERGGMVPDSTGMMCWADMPENETPDWLDWHRNLPRWLRGLRLPLR